MIYKTATFYLLLVLMAALTSACAGPPDSSGSSVDNNAAQAASGTQSGTSPATSPVAQPPAAQKDSVELTPKENADQPDDDVAKNVKGPKLSVPVKRIEFGEQMEGKLITRAFEIKNKGNEPLKIEAVEPS